MHLKWQKLWERFIRVEGDYFEGDGGEPMLIFDQTAAPVPEIMDG
jgi:hypothetical protein